MQTNQLLLLARIAEMGRELAQIKRSLTQSVTQAPTPLYPWLSVPEDKRAYHCHTQELFDAVCQALHEQGHTWARGEAINSQPQYWQKYKEQTCVCCYLRICSYGRLDSFQVAGYTIVPAEEALAYWASQKPKAEEPKPADFTKPGYLTGKDARNRLSWLLGYAPRYAVTPYTEDDKGLIQLDNGTWQAYDNSQGECFVEEFGTEAEAKAWLAGKEVPHA